jgi:transketolase
MERVNFGNKDTRSGFGEGLRRLGEINPKVVALCADLTGSLKMDAFEKAFPERFFQIGIAEANMMGIAAGMTLGGSIPFTGTFANFSTSRVYDQIRQSIAYSQKNVKICASHAGLTLGEDGATHQVLEDIGMMRMLPNMTVVATSNLGHCGMGRAGVFTFWPTISAYIYTRRSPLYDRKSRCSERR